MIGELEAIKQLLWEDWDPIGVNELGGPKDEYDSYAFRIFVMLSDGADCPEIEAYLRQLEIEHMELQSSGCEQTIAKRIMEIHGGAK